jgi:hypothetical protein
MSHRQRIVLYALLTGVFTAIVAFIVTVNYGQRAGGAAAICAAALGGFVSFLRTRKRDVTHAK